MKGEVYSMIEENEDGGQEKEGIGREGREGRDERDERDVRDGMEGREGRDEKEGREGKGGGGRRGHGTLRGSARGGASWP